MVTSAIDVLAVDPEVADAIRQEEQRQRFTVELIASENFVSAAVLRAVGSVLTNKYAEGILAGAITAVVNMSMPLRLLPSTAQSSFSARSTSTCNRIPAPTPTSPPILP